jgi:aminoglycoside phosphotransferase (APT) family kinase protein
MNSGASGASCASMAVGTPPATEAEWRGLLQHLAAIHTLTPDKTNVRLPKAVINANHARDGRRIVRQQLAYIPPEAQPESLRALVRRFEASRFPGWTNAPRALCRVDLNTSNFIRRAGLWASVDWENGGWGDPAFDVANLMTHVAYITVSLSHWDWAAATYCSLVDDAVAPIRIQVYYKILLVWWAARMARYLYQVPRGLDTRLVAWSEERQANMAAQYEHYLHLAQEAYF